MAYASVAEMSDVGLAIGDSVGGYVLRRQLGEGGQAEVWQAEDPRAPALAWALKLIHVARVPPRRLDRLRREADELSAIAHPSVVRCFGLLEDRERAVVGLVMEFVEGRSLTRALRDRRFDERMAQLLLGHLASALAHIHARNLVHRDVKLDNVLVTNAFFSKPEDPHTVKLIDFGIVASEKNPEPLTRAGHVIGTGPYLAPEQLDARHWGGVSHATTCDVFSLGVLAWRLLANDISAHPTGAQPSSDLEHYALAYRYAEHDLWPPTFANPRWNAFMRKALALHPRDRLRDGRALLDALRKVPTLDDPTAAERRTITIPGEPAFDRFS